MPRIDIKTTFLDGPNRFEAGDTRTVSDEQAARFVAAGWAALAGQEATTPASGPVTLDTHNAAMGLGDSNG